MTKKKIVRRPDWRTADEREIENAVRLACMVAHMLNGPIGEPVDEPLSPEIDLYRVLLADQMDGWLVPQEWRARLERALTVWHHGWRHIPIVMLPAKNAADA